MQISIKEMLEELFSKNPRNFTATGSNQNKQNVTEPVGLKFSNFQNWKLASWGRGRFEKQLLGVEESTSVGGTYELTFTFGAILFYDGKMGEIAEFYLTAALES